VVDPARWTGFSLLVGFNDAFFMSLMFFLSGLFVWTSLSRKGSAAFMRDRGLRLGLPFVVAAALLAPLAYFPTYLMTGAIPSLAGFVDVWLSLGNWPAGPAWFLWVLLAFDAVAAALFVLAPKAGDVLGRLSSVGFRRPAVFFGRLILVSAIVYVPMALAFSPMSWMTFGPFTVQTSRVVHYFVYFLAGIGVGVYGVDRGLLAIEGRLRQRWPAWMAAALALFIIAAAVTIAALQPGRSPHVLATFGGVAFAASCAASSFAFLALFVRFATTRTRLFDSLRDNAYGMYLLHYVVVSWLQYALLPAPLSGLAKGALIFFGTVVVSWAASAALRRVPAVARVI
jgi:peptidoglycan/LPS O-acetylase OafA/YrhL